MSNFNVFMNSNVAINFWNMETCRKWF